MMNIYVLYLYAAIGGGMDKAMNFVAIDFETATSGEHSICSMGICVVMNNKVTETKEILIKPVPFEFNERNIMIHHITPEMVINRQTFDAYWKEIFPYLNDRIVVAHNASFDVGALINTLTHFNLEFPNFKYICTVKLSQKAYPELPSHKLNNLADALGIDFSHHQAGDDAYACAMVLIKILEDFNLNSLEEIEKKFDLGVGYIYPGCHIPCTKNKKKKQKNTVSPPTLQNV